MTADLTSKFESDASVVGNWLSLPEPAIAELFASMPFDFVIIDMEHTAITLEQVTEAVRAIDAADGEVGSIVRLPGHDADLIDRVLDVGVDGLMLPMVETAAEAASIVESCRYPPAGTRGVGPGRGATYGLDLQETIETDDDSFAITVQIESPEAVDNAREIAAVDGIDALFVGPGDLSMLLGSFGEIDDRLHDRIDAVIEGAADAGTPVGTIGVGEEQIAAFGGLDFDFFVVGFDAQLLVEGTEQALASYESVSSR